MSVLVAGVNFFERGTLDVNNFLSKFKLDAHHTIERFGVFVLVLTIITSILMTSIIITKVTTDAETMTDKAIYTTSFTTSLSDINGTVESAYRNKDMTDFFLLLKFEDVSKISSDANDYQLFLTACDLSGNLQSLKSTPAAMVYMFGSSGYMGLHFVNNDGFPQQIYHLIVRSNSSYVSKSVEDATEAPDKSSDESFSSHDQFTVNFNPGGADAKVVSFLDEEEMSMYDVFYTTVIKDQEAEQRKVLNTDLANMYASLAQINKYAKLLENDSKDSNGNYIVAPDLPAVIRKDKVIAKKDGETLVRDRDMWKSSADEVVKEDNVMYYFNTDYVVPQGFDFNWQDSSIKDGYLKNLCPDGDYVKYFNDKASESTSDADSITTSDIKFYYKNGTEFKYDSGKNTTNREAKLNTDIQNLLTEWQNYYNLKKAYQTTDLQKLLMLELDTIDAANSWTRTDGTTTVLYTY